MLLTSISAVLFAPTNCSRHEAVVVCNAHYCNADRCLWSIAMLNDAKYMRYVSML